MGGAVREDPNRFLGTWNPPPSEATLWRYVTLARLTSLVLRREDGLGRLFFARADLLGDPHEGAATSAILERRDAALGTLEETLDGEFSRGYHDFMQNWRRHFGVSCWHMNDGESAALWQLYSQGEGAVALRSSTARLFDALGGSGRANKIEVGAVSYIDYQVDDFRSPGPESRLFHKRSAYSHEREVRAICWMDGADFPAHHREPGIAIPVDVEVLLDSVVLPPQAPPWIGETVERLVRTTGYGFQVEVSRLDEQPRF